MTPSARLHCSTLPHEKLSARINPADCKIRGVVKDDSAFTIVHRPIIAGDRHSWPGFWCCSLGKSNVCFSFNVMPTTPRTIITPSHYGSEWGRLVSVARSLKPARGPGVLTSHTQHGVFRKTKRVIRTVPKPSPDDVTQYKPGLNGNVWSIFVLAQTAGGSTVENIYLGGDFSWYSTTNGTGESRYMRNGFVRLNANLGITPTAPFIGDDSYPSVSTICPANQSTGSFGSPGPDSLLICGSFTRVNDGAINPGGGGLTVTGPNGHAARVDLFTGLLNVDAFGSATGQTGFGIAAQKAVGAFTIPYSGSGDQTLYHMLYGLDGSWNGPLGPIGMCLVYGDGSFLTGGAAPNRWTAPVLADGVTSAPICPPVMRVTDGGFYYVPGDGGGAVWKGFTPTSGPDTILLIDNTGTVDSTFDTNLGAGFDDMIEWIAAQSDGKVVAVGLFKNVDGTARSGIARINADGTHDLTFDPGAGFDFGGGAAAPQRVLIQEDGKILVSGGHRGFDGSAPNFMKLTRLNSDGSLDSSFDAGISGVDELTLHALGIKANGDVIVAGDAMSFGGKARNRIALLRSDGFCYGIA